MHASILVIGKGSQVGQELCTLDAGFPATVTGLTRGELDLTRAAEVAAAIAARKPQLVVNAAAYTAVDKAESEPDLAFAVNAAGPAAVALACTAIGAPLVHISTDYVFNGRKPAAYGEDDPVAPLGVYGRSKAAGEAAVRQACAHHIILRTSWVFSRHGANFVKTMLRLADARDELRIVDDQRGCPTPASDIARTILAIAQRVVGAGAEARWGTYHYAGDEAVTWFGFAQAIFAARRAATGRPAPRLVPITTADYPTAAQRPANSVLDCGKLAATFGLRASDWRGALPGLVAKLAGEVSQGS